MGVGVGREMDGGEEMRFGFAEASALDQVGGEVVADIVAIFNGDGSKKQSLTVLPVTDLADAEQRERDAD